MYGYGFGRHGGGGRQGGGGYGRGFGRGGGYSHGRGGGYGYGRGVAAATAPSVPSGYAYIGPCRCGYGPNAYYRDPTGKVVPAADVFAAGPVQSRPAAEPGESK